MTASSTSSLPLISVIVPVYNVEQYLDRCLDSIVNQSYKNLEIILVDDGSPDRCPQMCDDWAKRDSRIKVIHKKNAGLGYARNSGMEVATGEYVAFVDSDDYIDLDMYATLMAKAVEHDADIVSCGLHRQLKDMQFADVIDFKEETVIEGREAMDKLATRYMMYPQRHDLNMGVWHAVYRKSVAATFVSEREYTPEDLFFQVETTLNANKFVYIPKAFYYYTFNPNGLVRSYNFSNIKGFVDGAIHIKEILKQYGIEGVAEPYIFLKVSLFMSGYYRRKDKPAAERRNLISQVLHYDDYIMMLKSAPKIDFGAGLKGLFYKLSFKLQRGSHAILYRALLKVKP